MAKLTLLYQASQNGDLEMLEKLHKDNNYDNINDQDKDGKTALHYAINSNSFETAKFLIETMGARTDVVCNKRKTLLHHAVIANCYWATALLIDKVNVTAKDKDGNTALHNLAFNPFADSKILELLIKHSKSEDLNIKNNSAHTPLYIAVEFRNLKAAKCLLEHEADVNTQNNNGSTALHHAIAGRHLEAVKLLIEYKADVNAQNALGTTALHHAILLRDNINLIKLLIKAGADPNIQDNNPSYTALHLSIHLTHLGAVKLILQHSKIDPNIQDNKGRTPLHLALMNFKDSIVIHNKLLIMKLLLSKDANPNITDNDGNTVLHYAAAQKSFDAIKLLIEFGADVSFKNDKGDLPLDIARNINCPEKIIDYLEKSMSTSTSSIIAEKMPEYTTEFSALDLSGDTSLKLSSDDAD